ncbi:MAG: hypothetical protein QM811_22690 [Pirellulales bacterium]
MRVGVTGAEQHLKEHDARRPNAGRTAEPGQQRLGDDRLDQEEQKRALNTIVPAKTHHSPAGRDEADMRKTPRWTSEAKVASR